MLAFVQSYSQSQARLMFATTFGMDNFGCTKMNVASYPGSSPTEKWGESLEDLITCPVTYYAWFCVVLIIELVPTQSVLSVISADTAILLYVAETTDWH